MLDLPTNEELSCVIFDHAPEVKNYVSVADANQLCIVVWEVEKEVEWFTGYVKEILEYERFTSISKNTELFLELSRSK